MHRDRSLSKLVAMNRRLETQVSHSMFWKSIYFCCYFVIQNWIFHLFTPITYIYYMALRKAIHVHRWIVFVYISCFVVLILIFKYRHYVRIGMHSIDKWRWRWDWLVCENHRIKIYDSIMRIEKRGHADAKQLYHIYLIFSSFTNISIKLFYPRRFVFFFLFARRPKKNNFSNFS